jgi:YD repeat-containing protein
VILRSHPECAGDSGQMEGAGCWLLLCLRREATGATKEDRRRRSFVYNDGGYLTRRIDRRGLVREFQYDTLGRNTAEIWYDTAADAEMDANRQDTLNFTYDALGRMLSAGDQFASYAYAYDRLGRMTSSDAAIAGLVPTVTLTNAYDAAGRRTQVAAAISGNANFVTDYMYDQLGRTTSIWQYAAGSAVRLCAEWCRSSYQMAI